MCGIVGFCSANTNGFTTKEANVFETMLFLDQLRGMDSTGVFGVDKHSNVGIVKGAVHGTDFLRTSEYRDWRGKLLHSGLFAVGHNRAATRGTVSDENAHPFYVDDKIVLVQNGTYKGSHKHLKDTEVDTEAIAHVIAEESDVEKALQRINSAYALVWFNTENGTLNLIRNDERPLYITYTADDAGVIFASEMETILYACSRHDLKLKCKPYLLKEHHLVTCEIQGNHFEQTSKDINSKYVYPKSNTTGGAFGYEGFDNIHEIYTGETSRVNRSQNHRTSYSKHDVARSFHDHLLVNMKEVLFDNREDAVNAESYWNSAIRNNKVIIELRDAVKANDHAECAAWHVWGYLLDSNVDAEENEDPRQVIAHWLVYNKTESEMISYVTDYFYRGTPSSVVLGAMQTGGKRVYYAQCFISQTEPIKLEPTPTEVIENATQH